MLDKRKAIKGVKEFGGKAVYTGGKYGLKAALKIPELAFRGGSKVLGALSSSDQFQVIATTAGLVTASIMCPPVILGVAGMVGAKFAADKVLDKPQPSLLKSLKETILLGNNVTKLACDRVISPATKFVDDKAKDLGAKAQRGVNDLFER